MKKVQDVFYCDFCAKSQHEVMHIVKGLKDIAICSECVDTCNEVIQEQEKKRASS